MCYGTIMTYEVLLDEALALPESQRVALVRRLTESLSRDGAAVEAAWVDEINRRIADLRSGNVKAVPADIAMAQIRAEFDAKHR